MENQEYALGRRDEELARTRKFSLSKTYFALYDMESTYFLRDLDALGYLEAAKHYLRAWPYADSEERAIRCERLYTDSIRRCVSCDLNLIDPAWHSLSDFYPLLEQKKIKADDIRRLIEANVIDSSFAQKLQWLRQKPQEREEDGSFYPFG